MSPDADMPVSITPAVATTPRRLVLVTLCLGVLIVQVDTSVVNLAVRPIGAYFMTSVATLQWVVDSYNLLYATLLLTGGLLADLYGRRRVFMGGAAIFTLASLGCAFAPSAMILVLARAIAGLGAALLLPASLAIIRVVWPDPVERSRVLGIWAASNGLALAIGPSLGGLLIHAFGWRSIFSLVVPIGLATFGLAPLCIPESANPTGRHFDAGGQILGATMLGGLAVAAIELHRDFQLAAVGLVCTLVTLLLFTKVEQLKGTAALVDLTMFRIKEFRGAMAATAAMTFGMYGILFLLPLVWQSKNILGPVGAGIALMPMASVFILVSPLSGTFTARFGVAPTICGGLGIIACGLMLVGATADVSSILVSEVGLGLTGLGMGLATGPLMGVAVAGVSVSRSGSAAALINVARMIGATLGVAVLGTVFSSVDGGPNGLLAAMFTAGCLQIFTAGAVWKALSMSASLP